MPFQVDIFGLRPILYYIYLIRLEMNLPLTDGGSSQSICSQVQHCKRIHAMR